MYTHNLALAPIPVLNLDTTPNLNSVSSPKLKELNLLNSVVPTPEGKKFIESEKKLRQNRPRTNKDICDKIKSVLAEQMKDDKTAQITETLASIKDQPDSTGREHDENESKKAAAVVIKAYSTALAQKLTRITKCHKSHY